jgi:hypothetical protein
MLPFSSLPFSSSFFLPFSQISPEDGASDITMVSGMMTVPGSEDGLVYDPGSKAQSELWALLLARLESAKAQ